MNRLISFLYLQLSFLSVFAQSEFDALQYRTVGPNRGGRATTVAGTRVEPGTFYFGATGGGVWKTTDYGTSWDNVSDGFFASPSIGSIAVDQRDPNIVYVGTGSDGLRSNVISGSGMYKSVNGGKTWEHIGLANTGHIGAVVIHPDNYNIVYVAAIGNAFAPNSERGVFKTIDGGKTWEKIMFISDRVGFSDLELLPGNPEIVFATAWKAERKPWTIISGGEQSEGGLYKSINGGKTWDKITKGLPQGLIGKMDLALPACDSKVVYVLAEAPDKEGGLFRSEDQGTTFVQVSDHWGIRNRPFYYTNIDVDPTNSDIIYALANGYFKSIDGGKSWKGLRPPHGDNHEMWINPDNPDLFIQCNDGGANVTMNGGKTWSTQFNQPTAELYTLDIDDQHPYWLYAGQQDNFSTIAVPSMAPTAIQAPETGWIINTGGCETGPAVPKPGDHNIVYANCKGNFQVYDKRTGLVKNYDIGATNIYGHNPKDLVYRFQRVAPIYVSKHNPANIYMGSQFLHKTTNEGELWEVISPDLTAFEADKQVVPGSPITRDVTGEEYYSTLYSIAESPVKEGVLWTGSNDGPVHVTMDGGKTWKNVTPKMPTGGRVDAVEPSPHNVNKAYIAVHRYMLGDWKPYIYRTNDAGKTWTLLTTGTNGIPANAPTRVVREDPNKEGVLYAGTETGMYISLDDGKSWKPFQQNLPITPITDIKLYRNDLAMTTMGRGFWILDDVTPLHQYAANSGSEVALYKPRDTYRYQSPMFGNQFPQPAVYINYYLPTDIQSPIRLDLINDAGETVNTYISGKKASKEIIEDMNLSSTTYLSTENLSTKKGLNRFAWNMQHFGPWDSRESRSYLNGPTVRPGKYTVRLTVDGKAMEQTFELLIDPRYVDMGVSLDAIKANEKMALEIKELVSESRKLLNDLNKEKDKKDIAADRLEKVKGALKELDTEDGIYMTPMLVDQISYLYYSAAGNDQAPGNDAKKRLAELKEKLEKVKQGLN